MVDPYWIGAQICAVIASVNSVKGKRWTMDDFLPRVQRGKSEQRQSTEEMLAMLRGM